MKKNMKMFIVALSLCHLSYLALPYCSCAMVENSPANNSLNDHPPRKSAALLTLQSGNHEAYFTPRGMYIAGKQSLFVETFEGVDDGKPQRVGDGDISYHNLWPGIHLKYESRENGSIESIYHVEPGADLTTIQLSYNHSVSVENNGSLQFSHPSKNGHFSMTAPKAWQERDGITTPVDIRYTILDDHSIGFSAGSYDTTKSLYIDPIYEYHALLGNDSSYDTASNVALDSDGNIYVVGSSNDSWSVPIGGGFSALPKNPHSGDRDIVIIKFNREGTYQWHTFCGGTEHDDGRDIAIDQSGDIYVTGQTRSAWNGPMNELPIHAHSNPASPSPEIVIVKLNSDGAYQWHTFYGSTGLDIAYGITVDTSGDIIIAGNSGYTWGGSPQNSHSGGQDICVVKLSASGGYQWHTFHGSTGADYGYEIGVDSGGNIVVTGESDAAWNGPAPGSQPPLNQYSGGEDLVVLKLNSSGEYQYHSFYGSAGSDGGRGIAIDRAGNVYISGYSLAAWDGPGGTGPVNSYTGEEDILVLKLDASGSYQWHTFHGSTLDDGGKRAAVDQKGSVYIAGYSRVSWTGPAEQNPINDHTDDGIDDITVLKLNSGGKYQTHTFLGSIVLDYGNGVAVDGNGDIYIAGYSGTLWNGPGEIPPKYSVDDNDAITLIKCTGGLSFPWPVFLPAILKD